jgi:hypothetical protein
MNAGRRRRARFLGDRARYGPYLLIALVFAASRIAYRCFLDLGFDSSPPSVFIQYINPWFVQRDLLRSVLYLHQQAPLQNLMVGGCVRIFGTPAAFKVLYVVYVAVGLTIALSVLHVMLRIGVSRAIAVTSAALYTASPVTAYFENWLFYHAPVAALHLLSLVALLRYYRLGTLGAGILSFGLFALSGLFYALYGPIVLMAMAMALLIRPPRPDRRGVSPRVRLIAALAIPLSVLVLDKARTRLLVGHSQGDAYLWENLAVKTFDSMRPGERNLLEMSGRISRAPELVLFSMSLSAYDGDMRIAHPPTGVPLLDLDYAPGGGVNAHSLEKVLIAESFYKKDAMYLLANEPAAYWQSVFNALTGWYFMSPMDYDDSVPTPNREHIRRAVKETNALFLPDENGTERLLVVVLPLTVLYGLYRVLGARGSLESERSIVGAILFMLPIIAYVTFSTELVAVGDFSRYRYNVDPFYVILFALLATDCVERTKTLWRSARRFQWGRPSRAATLGT